MRARKKKWAPALLESEPSIVLREGKLPIGFPPQSLELEIGGGKGDFAIGMAKKGHRILSIERDASIAGLFLKKLLREEEKLPVWIANDDFDNLNWLFGDLRFSTVYLNFSDPWPKKRHEKRRLTSRNRLKEIVGLLEDNGVLIMKTDNEGLYEFTKGEAESLGLELEIDDPDYRLEPTDTETEYERNFRSQGVKIKRLVIRKGKNDV